MKQNKSPIINAAKFYYATLGLRGLIAGTCHYLLGWPRQIKVVPPGMEHAVFLRLRTSDILVYHFVLLSKEYRVDVSKFSPHTIIDAGANIGLASVYFAKRYPDAQVIAVEPEVTNYRAMLKNIAPYSNITPIQAALWKTDGTVNIGLPDSDTREKWAFSVTGSNGTTRAMTLTTLLSTFGIQTLDLLKVDIEGAEKEVFETCDCINRIRAIVIETHDRLKPGCADAVDNVTREFDRSSRGELTFYLRPGIC